MPDEGSALIDVARFRRSANPNLLCVNETVREAHLAPSVREEIVEWQTVEG